MPNINNLVLLHGIQFMYLLAVMVMLTRCQVYTVTIVYSVIFSHDCRDCITPACLHHIIPGEPHGLRSVLCLHVIAQPMQHTFVSLTCGWICTVEAWCLNMQGTLKSCGDACCAGSMLPFGVHDSPWHSIIQVVLPQGRFQLESMLHRTIVKHAASGDLIAMP